MGGKEREFLLRLGKRAIEYYLETGKELEVNESEVPEELKKERACFVTLTKNGQLRGCIGNIESIGSLYESVISNAVSAGFYDPRFGPVEKNELKDLGIEISVLGNFREIRNIGEIREMKDGVIMEKDGRRAVFLPQVWEELPDKERFLSQLALKAGLNSDGWKEAEYKIFKVEIIA